ncbi:transcriptional-regulating factor 1-like [Limanda limanda]|uniref:transcriptional-regulating factor 1-like n=1 Tax=Limanda limanda TaxID=27771 RepID=UPI0029C65467|nr:transcriptional-regulating factor 1-like [Limanda limanda]
MMKSSQPENNTKVLDNSRLLCTVCNRDFRSLPALNGHMRSHSCLKKGEVPPVRPPVAVVMPVSVPVQSRAASRACRGGPRRSGRLVPATGGAVLYRSLLHLEEQEVVTREVGGHYTPPPMLCPIRAGPGLYCSVTTRGQRRAQTLQLHSSNNGLSDLVAMETPTTEINKPRINVGRGFQAEVLPLSNHEYAHSDSQNALWLPCDELEKPVNQQRVTTLLTMARSSVVPGGGASPEHALHVLSQSAGDFLLTLEKLLSSPESSDRRHADVAWSAAETTALVKSLRLHRKDFSRVQRAVQTKSVSQCVEFYYRWKKQLSLRATPPAGLSVTLPESKGRRPSDQQHGDDLDPE